jgi:hypothetical protein
MSDKHQIDIEELQQGIEEWIKENPGAPEMVQLALRGYIDLLSVLDAKSAKVRSLLKQLRQHYGIEPKSERQRNGKRRSKKKRPKTAEECHEHAQRSRELAKWHEKLAKRHRRKAAKLEDRETPVEDIELTKEELAEADEAVERLEKACRAGQCCDLDLASPREELMEGVGAEQDEEDVECSLDEQTKARANRIFQETRTRIDLKLSVILQHVSVEKAELPGPDGPTILSASTDHLGPSKMSVTWGFLSTITILVAQYALPLNRLAGLICSPEKTFTSTDVTRYFHWVAERLCSVYLQLARELAESDIFLGDDTSTRVLEVSAAWDTDEEEKPWSSYADQDSASDFAESSGDQVDLCQKVASVLGFEARTKKDDKAKKSLNVSLLSAKSTADPMSTIVFYRTHLGNLGNLLDTLLNLRISEDGITLHADMASVNKAVIHDRQVSYSACAAHARRRFVKCIDVDPYAASIVHHFDMLFHYESMIDTYGRNKENTLLVRQNHSAPVWDYIVDSCHEITKKWSKKTALGDAANYVLRHKEALTLYLSNPKVTLHNNFSERLLRLEKLILKNSLFRKSIKGRTALDICRTIVQTAIAAGADPKEYLEWVLRFDASEVSRRPQDFTPYAYRKNPQAY